MLSILTDSVKLYRAFKTTFIDNLGTIVKAVPEVFCSVGDLLKVSSHFLHQLSIPVCLVPLWSLTCGVRRRNMG